MGNVKIDMKQLEALRDKLAKADKTTDDFLTQTSKELAARLLRKVIKRTPVGTYTDGRVGGTLRRGWNVNKDFRVQKVGSNYIIEIVNPVEYASYVNYGHRTRNGGGKGWVEGQFFLEISENELQKSAPAIVERRIYKWLGGVLSD